MKVKCPNCGAEFESEEAGIVTCPYCGFQIKLGEAKTFTYDLKVEDPWRPLSSFIRLQRLSPNDVEWKARILERELLYIPFYVFFVKAEGLAHSGGLSTADGRVEFFNYVTVPAADGFDELINYPLPTRGRRYFDGNVGGRLVEKSLNEGDAEKRLKREIRELLKMEAKRYFHWRSVSMGMPTFELQFDGLVYYPIWKLKYKYGPFTYRAYVDGADGRIPYAEFPISFTKRIVNALLGFGLLASGFFFGRFFMPYGATAVLGSMAGALFGAWPSLKRAFRFHGKASEHRLLSEVAEDFAPEGEAFEAIRRFLKAHF
ncbi:hypothetical protein, conserved [Thermococcus onnurineus NA1]|uniref:Uncharacterized protein n=1 Tax=Thermococcus onnurineus (strain NA1) TaxID=523850 RepID=B6YU04_THEON|nr:hypothetical protein [Thermococcus onnurineus]ACJ15946.1 hypothetical protein, conserved [Thermococcus onnurineus NA1]